MPDRLRIGLLGHGNVGAAFAGLLAERADAIEARTGRRPEITGILTRSQGTIEEIVDSADIVVELMGGLEPARTAVLRALDAGTHVVTANKQLLSRHGEELWDMARQRGAHLGFEAAVAGVVPVIRTLRESLAGAHVERVHGIVNGTTNFILTEMAREGLSYEDALRKAQELGYAEADPHEDVSGLDAAAKMAIIARLAFGARVGLDDVRCEGIEHVRRQDLRWAEDFGLELKLVGTAERVNGGISVRVHPAFLYKAHPLASVHGPFNAVTIESDAITEITLQGPGAGGIQTASAVLGDVVACFDPPASLPPPRDGITLVDDATSAFYLVLEVEDKPGVLAGVAEVLGLQGVSVKSVVQRGLGDRARLVMVLHSVLESRFEAARRMLASHEAVKSEPRAIRVIEEDFET